MAKIKFREGQIWKVLSGDKETILIGKNAVTCQVTWDCSDVRLGGYVKTENYFNKLWSDNVIPVLVYDPPRLTRLQLILEEIRNA